MKGIFKNSTHLLLFTLSIWYLNSCDSNDEDSLPTSPAQTAIDETDTIAFDPVVTNNEDSTDENVSSINELFIKMDIPYGSSGIMSPILMLGDLYDESLVILENSDGGIAELLLDKKYLKYTPPPTTDPSNWSILLETNPDTNTTNTIIVRFQEKVNCKFGGTEDILSLKKGESVILDPRVNDDMCTTEQIKWCSNLFKIDPLPGFPVDTNYDDIISYETGSNVFGLVKISIPMDLPIGKYEMVYNICNAPSCSNSEYLPHWAYRLCDTYALGILTINVVE